MTCDDIDMIWKISSLHPTFENSLCTDSLLRMRLKTIDKAPLDMQPTVVCWQW